MVENEFGMLLLVALIVLGSYGWAGSDRWLKQRARKKYYRQINRIRKDLE